ncbi:MAG TPA: cytochrome c [Terriglobales bacterium]|nr:cytochrome c [Terriglobales bacterium]
MIMKRLVTVALGVGMLFLAGCRQDMQDQPKYKSLRGSTFFADGRGSRLPVANTVARGNLRADQYFYTGKINGLAANQLPDRLLKEDFKSMAELLARGQQRYQVYCTPCHSRAGDGNGMIPQRAGNTGSTSAFRPPSYHEDRLKKAPLGHFYDVMTNGFGVMLNYSAQINPRDRWAIAAYIRALQLSQDARIADVPESERDKIQTLGPQTWQPMTPQAGAASTPSTQTKEKQEGVRK